METTIREVADWVGGELLGDGSVTVREARTLNEAGPNDLTFVDGEKNLGAWKESSAAAAIVPLTVPPNGKPIIRVRDPLFAFATVVTRMRRLNLDFCPTGIHPSAVIDPTATIGPEPSIGPNVVIGRGAVIGARCRLLAGVAIGNETRLGDDVILHPHVVIYDRCTLGHRVIVHANSVIGADGFGYRTQQGQHVKTPQLGGVHLADDVEIGACTTIDRGTFSDTRIGSGTKIDNLVQIGHNCKIGSGNLIVSQVGIAGSCSTGDYVVLAGQVGIGDHCHLGDQVVVGAKSGIHSDIPAKSRVLGVPALPDRETMKIYMTLEKLPGMRRDLEKIKKQLDAGAKE